MAVEITLTIVSNEGSKGVKLTRTYEGGSDNFRFHADTVMTHGERLLLSTARQLAKLAELEGGALFDSSDIAERLGVRTPPEV